MKPTAPAVRCDACRLTAADWFPPDERGVRWTCRDIARRPDGRTLCHRCFTLHRLPPRL